MLFSLSRYRSGLSGDVSRSRSVQALAVLTTLAVVLSATGPTLAASITLDANRDNNLLASIFNGTGSGRQINDVNLGGVDRFAVGNSGGDDNRSILGFDVAPLAGQYDTINSVTMRLFFRQHTLTQDFSQSFDIELYKISSANGDWVEGTGVNDGNPADDTGSTWRHKNRSSANWASGTGTTATGGLQTPGVDYEAPLLGSISSGTTLPADGTPIDFNFTGTTAELTSLMDSLIADDTGFLLLSPTPGLVMNIDRMFFNSSEASDPGLRPQLIVNFSTDSVPEPGSAAVWCLLGVAVLRRRKRSNR